MSITFTELFDTRTTKIDHNGNYLEIAVHYVVNGATTEAEAVSAVRSGIPYQLNNLYLQSVDINEHTGNNIFKVTANYNLGTALGVSIGGSTSSVMNFDCSNQTKHMNIAYAQLRIFGKRDAQCMINWNGKSGKDMQVDGVDMPSPAMRITYTKDMTTSELNNTTYMRKIAKIVGRTNNATWKGWNKGEVMFLGTSYSAPMNGRGRVSVTFNFEVRMNEKVIVDSNGSIHAEYCDEEFETIINGSAATGFTGGTIFKTGFNYIYTISGTTVSNGASSIIPEDIYMDSVTKTADFSDLGI